MNELISIQNALQQAEQQLLAAGNTTTARLDAEVLLSHVLKQPRSFLYTWPERLLQQQQSQDWNHALQRRVLGEPVAYIVGEREFWSMTFSVTPATLIPRPETETLVAATLASRSTTMCRVLELGTGCGCIALALASERPEWRITATDQSVAALAVAQTNARRLGLQQVQWINSDWFATVPVQTYDLILANPPYIAASDPHLNQRDVAFEPRIALVGGEDGLDAVRHIATQAWDFLPSGGQLLFEIGYDQGAAATELMRQAGYVDVSIQQDSASHDRVCKAHRPDNLS